MTKSIPVPTEEEKLKACKLFQAGSSHSEALASIEHPPDPENKKIWGWMAEFESKGVLQ